jgi:hypothetical protein
MLNLTLTKIETNENNKKNNNEKFDISCKFTSTNKCPEKFFPFLSFTEYTIVLNTNKKKWEIKKRFNDFDTLNSELKKFNIKNLPKLPQKAIALFKSQEFIEERKKKLQKYLTSLLLREDIYSIDKIFDFIELKKEEYLLMKVNIEDSDKDSCPNSPYSNSSSSTRCSMNFKLTKNKTEQRLKEETIIKNDFFYGNLNFKINEETININENEVVKTAIFKFLEELNSKKNNNKSYLIKEFRDNLFECQRKKIPGFYYLNEDIYKLLFGDKSTKKLGIVFHCGDTKNIFAAEKSIEFLSNLLDYEYNIDSENFANILKIGKLDIFKQMNLRSHLASKKTSLFLNCCKIIKLILNEDKKISLKSLLQDDSLEKKVENWLRFNC